MSRLMCGLWFALAACGGGGGFPDAPESDSAGPTGTFSVTWSVVDQNSQPISCDTVSAQAMTVLAHNLAIEGGSTQIFSCNTGMGMSQGLAPGDYEMNFELSSGMFGALGMAAKQAPVAITANANLELAPVTFQVEAHGGIALKLATGKPNCDAVSAGGAGITAMTITLNHNSDLTCEPITLSISDGVTQPGGMYTINCTTPMTRVCIEENQTITAMGVPSDSYTIRVKGYVGANLCYLNADSIQVPPLNKLLLGTLNLGQQTQTPGC
ncbi:MAG TPA: hypothetical protein VFV99_16155 [Kofleriaceae bacterium]|nr:hypothetical protein [Kofleriaceae bacterium]